MYHVASHFDVPSDFRADFIDAADARNSMLKEAGTILRADRGRPEFDHRIRLWLNEAYVDLDAFTRHADEPHFKKFFRDIREFASWPRDAILCGTTITGSGAAQQGDEET